MFNLYNQQLKPQPFNAYRDPKTGQWIVIPTATTSANGKTA